MKKKGVEIRINLSNRVLYTLIVIGILAIVGVGVYALGSVPNPGHAISEIQPCDNGQILQMSGGEWTCTASLSGWSFVNDRLLDDDEQVFRTDDEWLRLNQAGHFSNGVYTPGVLRADGGIYVGDDESFYRFNEDIIQTDSVLISSKGFSGEVLIATGSANLESGCSESNWGSIRRCYNFQTDAQSVCTCSKLSSGWKWRMLA